MAPVADLGERFLAELSRHRRERPRPLPTEFRPLATQIAGPRPVRLSSDAATRRALRAVGKVAATTDDVIHVRERPSPEILAHELTHVGHPSPLPRFFADDRGGAEERRAHEIGRLMARAPVPSRMSAGSDRPSRSSSLPVAPAVAASLGRRRRAASARPAHRAARSAGTISVAELATRLTGSTPVVQRRMTATGNDTVASPPVTSTSAVAPPAAGGAPASTTDLLDQFDRIVELLEERIIVELERRGGRFRGGF